MISYYSPARKSVKWYRKILFECVSIAILDSWVLYNTFYSNKKIKLEQFTKSIANSLRGITEEPTTIQKTKNTPHELSEIPRKDDGKLMRKRCLGCYKKIAEIHNRNTAIAKSKQVYTQCIECQKPYCLPCFNEIHKNYHS